MSRASDTRELRPASQRERTTRILRRIFMQRGPLLPARPELIAAFWPDDEGFPERLDFDRALAPLLRDGSVRTVVVGTEPHWAYVGLQRGEHAQDVEGQESELFELRASIDVERERVLLYRACTVILVIGALLILRELLLRSLEG